MSVVCLARRHFYPTIADRSIDLSNAPLQRFEEFKKLQERATNDLENLHLLLMDYKAVHADETEEALRTCTRLNGDVRVSLEATLSNGKREQRTDETTTEKVGRKSLYK